MRDLSSVWPQRRLQTLSRPMGLLLTLLGLLATLAGMTEAVVLAIVATVASGLAVADGRAGATFGPVDLTTVADSKLLVVGFVAIAAYLVVEVVAGWAISRLLASTIYSVRRNVLETHARSSWPAKERLEGSALVQLATTNVSKAANTVAAMTGIIAAGVNFAVLLVVAVIIDPLAALVVFGGVLGLLVLSLPLSAVARRQNAYMASLNQQYAADVQEHSSIGREIEVFGIQLESLAKIDETNARHTRVIYRSRWVAKTNTAIFKASALVLILGLLAVAVAVDTGEIARFAAIALILLRSVSYGQAAQVNWHNLGESAAWLDQLIGDVDRLETAPDLDSRHDNDLRPRGADPLGAHASGLSFEYEAGRPVLDGLDFTIEPGSFVGIVGASGAGKSTLAELLLGLRNPTNGRLDLIGDHPRERVAFVPQEPVLVRGSIVENVRFHRPWITDDAVRDALASAHVLSEIDNWPEGLSTDPGSLGSRVSGGQKQRIAIARALAGQPGMLVLDEPTSALDSTSEARLSESIRELKGKVTVVVIAHRLTTLEGCDAVMVLQQGHVVSFGSLDQLGDLAGLTIDPDEISQR